MLFVDNFARWNNVISLVSGVRARGASSFSELTLFTADGTGKLTNVRTLSLRDSSEGNRRQGILPQHLYFSLAHGGGVLITGTLTDTLGGSVRSRAFWVHADDTLGVRFANKMNVPGYESQFHSVKLQTGGRGYTAYGVYFNDTMSTPRLLTASFGSEGRMGSLAEPLKVEYVNLDLRKKNDFAPVSRVKLKVGREFSDLVFDAPVEVGQSETVLYAEQSAEAATNYKESSIGGGLLAGLKRKCTSCARVQGLMVRFELFYSAASGNDSTVMAANFLNDSLGYQLGSYEYELFLARCVKDTSLKLCNEMTVSPLIIENNCYRSLYGRAVASASEAYIRCVNVYLLRK